MIPKERRMRKVLRMSIAYLRFGVRSSFLL
jgi:hypothetical protein